MSFRVWLAVAVLAALHVAALGAGWLAPALPEAQFREHALAPPSAQFWLGTDALGRDQFSRLLHGARISLFSGIGAALLAAIIGGALGLAAGLRGGWLDRAVMQAAEIFLSLPWTYALLALRAALPLDASPAAVLAGMLGLLAVVGWARPARLVRGIALSVRERHYVAAARSFGAGPVYLLRRHILPAVRPALAEFVCLAAPQFVAAEVTLSFLGLGLQEPAASWGTMLAAYTRYETMTAAPWMAAPAVALAVTALCYYGVFGSVRQPRPGGISS
ncbi:MAG: ABC transporter permease [Bryobacterales bacterium]|nr:ABC transporter permease [Bryobacterales bacterium]